MCYCLAVCRPAPRSQHLCAIVKVLTGEARGACSKVDLVHEEGSGEIPVDLKTQPTGLASLSGVRVAKGDNTLAGFWLELLSAW